MPLFEVLNVSLKTITIKPVYTAVYEHPYMCGPIYLFILVKDKTCGSSGMGLVTKSLSVARCQKCNVTSLNKPPRRLRMIHEV